MIITTMTPREIMEEYERDYPEIRRRLFSYLRSNDKALKARFKRTGEKKIIPPEPRSTVVNGNRYRIWLRIDCCSSGFKSFEATVYQIIQDARTGKPRIWILSTPSDKGVQYVLEFKIDAIKKLCPGIPMKEAIDSFMKRISNQYTLYQKSESSPYNFEASFGDGLIGFGLEEPGRFTFEKIYKTKEIEELGDSLGLDGNQDPMKIYNLWIESKNKVEEIPETLGDKEKEIELAWKEYENNIIQS
jgi:hypothetical protein